MFNDVGPDLDELPCLFKGRMFSVEHVHHTGQQWRHVAIEEESHAAMLRSNSTAAMTRLEWTLYQSATSSAFLSLASQEADRIAVAMPTSSTIGFPRQIAGSMTT